MTQSMLEVALEYWRSGLNVIPVTLDGKRRPMVAKWAQWHEHRQTEDDIRRAFSRPCGIAVLGGKTSGGLEIIDFDRPGSFEPWCELVEKLRPGLVTRLTIVKTPCGHHVYFRSPVNGPSQPTIAKASEPYKKLGDDADHFVIIETKGQGGYVVAAPTPGIAHKSGLPYSHLKGPALTEIQKISEDERDALLNCARTFNEQFAEEYMPASSSAAKTKSKSGDDFDTRATWAEVLEPHGFTRVHEIGPKTYWCRPGKSGDVSATTGEPKCGGKLWLFSTSVPQLQAGRAYNKFSAYGHLNHGGDFKAAAKDLLSKGYGEPNKPRKQSKSWDELQDIPPPSGEYAPSNDKPQWITASELEELIDDDPAAIMRPGIFDRVVAMESNREEWHRIGDLLRRKKQKDAFNRELKKHKKSKASQPAGESWKSELSYRTNKDGDQILERCLSNLVTILKNDSAWSGAIALNTLSNKIETVQDLPFSRDTKKSWNDSDTIETKIWLERNYGIRPTTTDVHEAVTSVAHGQKYNPLVNYINGLESHDKEVLDTWLIDVFGVADTPYARAVGRRWMISAVARALDPGCKADCVLILEGEQGIKKSTTLSQLCPDESWFIDGLSDFGSKDQKEEIEGKWIVELGELKGFGKELEQIKAFTSRTSEKYRPSYARCTVESPRTCVFAGTVNPDNVGYLRDVTGNRRFWPVLCRKTAPRITPDMRDRLWSEARDAYLSGVGKERDESNKWWIDPEESDLHKSAVAEQEQRVELDVWHDSVQRYLHGRPDSSVSEVLAHLGVTTDKQQQSAGQRVGRIFKMLRWSKYKAVLAGGMRQWRYQAPGHTLTLIPDAA